MTFLKNSKVVLERDIENQKVYNFISRFQIP